MCLKYLGQFIQQCQHSFEIDARAALLYLENLVMKSICIINNQNGKKTNKKNKIQKIIQNVNKKYL
ncbi:unnamed protein product [Paramecium primaurelia]|uniref:Uncharacterized protein n=1 Tax=Paramecium primaurelia TaxID=5886 RepID=A0A8S1JRG5_PARPR|nr:unnamed protein product [Paramecium primaurelia]